jgi:hypothetical protein
MIVPNPIPDISNGGNTLVDVPSPTVTFDLVIRYNADGYASVATGENYDDDDSCITDDWEYNACDTSSHRQVRVTVVAPKPVRESFTVTLPEVSASGPVALTMMSEG